jgi:hypothetical protein
MARPWIAGGLMLVLMETLADFGAVSIFNFDTFTTAIYKAWFGFFSLSAAAGNSIYHYRYRAENARKNEILSAGTAQHEGAPV